MEPQLTEPVDRPPSGADWVHEIKFDGYRMQLRVENGKAKLLTRKGLDWTAKFKAIARAAEDLPDAILDGEVVALDHNGAPDFAALQAALSDGKSEALVYFAFDLLFEGKEDLRKLPLDARKERLEALLGKHAQEQNSHCAMSSISPAAARRCCNRPAACRWKASSPRSATGPILQDAAPTGPRPNAAPGMKW